MEPKIVKIWDEINPVVYDGKEALSTRLLERNYRQLRECLICALEWIDAVPDDTVLPTMPGFDRDYVDGVLDKTR